MHSLTLTDVATGWTECLALRNRGQQIVFAALVRARAQLPFPLLGIDSDNGGEFINAHLLRYCQAEQLHLHALSALQEERSSLRRAEELVDRPAPGRLRAL